MDSSPQYLSLADAARYLSFSPRAFRDLVKKYLLPAYGPKRNRFRRSDLENFMENPVIFLAGQVTLKKTQRLVK